MATFSFTLDIQPGWTPASFASPAGWFKSSAGVTLSGNEVTQWADQSGVGNHLTPKSVNEQGYYIDGQVGAFYRQDAGGGFYNSLLRRTTLVQELDLASISGGLICACPGAASPLISLGSSFGISNGSVSGAYQHLSVWDGSTHTTTGLLHQSRKMWVSWRNNGTALEVWSNHGHYTGTKLSTAALASVHLASLASANGAPCQFTEIALSAVALSDSDQAILNSYLAFWAGRST